jgi:oxygen-independent coproporphyrinogen III oxidase
MTGLRTKWGVDLAKIEEIGGNKWRIENGDVLNEYLAAGMIQQQNQIISLTNQGKLFADRIASDLFLV